LANICVVFFISSYVMPQCIAVAVLVHTCRLIICFQEQIVYCAVEQNYH
jgi:hypothetical protein